MTLPPPWSRAWNASSDVPTQPIQLPKQVEPEPQKPSNGLVIALTFLALAVLLSIGVLL